MKTPTTQQWNRHRWRQNIRIWLTLLWQKVILSSRQMTIRLLSRWNRTKHHYRWRRIRHHEATRRSTKSTSTSLRRLDHIVQHKKVFGINLPSELIYMSSRCCGYDAPYKSTFTKRMESKCQRKIPNCYEICNINSLPAHLNYHTNRWASFYCIHVY